MQTNLLYDAVLIPNIGGEVYLGSNISVAGNLWSSWWSSRSSGHYWRTYGGYFAGRYWFGHAAHVKPLSGHHAGIYAQALLYDFTWRGHGYLSGEPGKNIFYKPSTLPTPSSATSSANIALCRSPHRPPSHLPSSLSCSAISCIATSSTAWNM